MDLLFTPNSQSSNRFCVLYKIQPEPIGDVFIACKCKVLVCSSSYILVLKQGDLQTHFNRSLLEFYSDQQQMN